MRSVLFVALVVVSASCASPVDEAVRSGASAFSGRLGCVHAELNPALNDVFAQDFLHAWRQVTCEQGRWVDDSACVHGPKGQVCATDEVIKASWISAQNRSDFAKFAAQSIDLLGGRVIIDGKGQIWRSDPWRLTTPSGLEIELEINVKAGSSSVRAEHCVRLENGELRCNFQFAEWEGSFPLYMQRHAHQVVGHADPNYNCAGYVVSELYAEPRRWVDGSYISRFLHTLKRIHYFDMTDSKSRGTLSKVVQNGDVITFHHPLCETIQWETPTHLGLVEADPDGLYFVSKHGEGPLLRQPLLEIEELAEFYGYDVAAYRHQPRPSEGEEGTERSTLFNMRQSLDKPLTVAARVRSKVRVPGRYPFRPPP